MPLAPECPEEMPGYAESCAECGEAIPHCACCDCPRCDPSMMDDDQPEPEIYDPY